jgi:DNA repair protein SbcD/Mre11
MRFSYIHAADLHIDSPFSSLSSKDSAVAERFATAGRKAVEALITETIESKSAFLIIAGDIFDGDWKDVTTGYFFAKELGRLKRAGIPVFLVKGNHDAENLMSRGLPYPDNVRSFASNKSETFELKDLSVSLHGRSFGSRTVADDFVKSYPARREGWLNIGVLHTALDGARGHATYAPCSVDDLRQFGYDYWALGHVHAPAIVTQDPWIVYPGNLQGRSVRETGKKGAVRVNVEDGRIAGVEWLELDAARWAHETIDVSSCSIIEDVHEQIRVRLADVHGTCGGRPLAVRLTLQGATPHHAHLIVNQETFCEDARAVGLQIAEDCWVEQVKIATSELPIVQSPLADADVIDIGALLGRAASDVEFTETVMELIKEITEKLPRSLRDHPDFIAGTDVEKLRDEARSYLMGRMQK